MIETSRDLNDPPKNKKLQMELTVTIDAGDQFVKATYRLEGDGPLVYVLTAYKKYPHYKLGFQMNIFTNAVAIKLSSDRKSSEAAAP